MIVTFVKGMLFIEPKKLLKLMLVMPSWGRVVDALGRPIDNKGPIRNRGLYAN